MSRIRASFNLLLAILISNSFIVSHAFGQVSGPSGFDNYITPNNVESQFCHFAITRPNNSFFRPFTPWTTPSDFPYYEAKTFRTVIGTVPFGPDSFTPPLFPYTIYVYEGEAGFLGNTSDPLSANTQYIKKYTFNPPHGSEATFVDTGKNMSYPSGSGSISVRMYETTFSLSQASTVTPAGPLYLSKGKRYWFSLSAPGPTPAYGFICMGRTDPASIASPEPAPALSFPMTPQQCSDWGHEYPCSFQLATQDYFKIAEPGPQYGLCYPTLSPVNTINAIYEPRLPTPDCLGNDGTITLPCCQRAFAGRWAMALQVKGLRKIPMISKLAAPVATVDCSPPDC